jgi:hypothetical protein
VKMRRPPTGRPFVYVRWRCELAGGPSGFSGMFFCART